MNYSCVAAFIQTISAGMAPPLEGQGHTCRPTTLKHDMNAYNIILLFISLSTKLQDIHAYSMHVICCFKRYSRLDAEAHIY